MRKLTPLSTDIDPDRIELRPKYGYFPAVLAQRLRSGSIYYRKGVDCVYRLDTGEKVSVYIERVTGSEAEIRADAAKRMVALVEDFNAAAGV